VQELKSLCDKSVRLCGKVSFIAVCSSVIITEFQLPTVPIFNFMATSAVYFFTSRRIYRANFTANSADMAEDGKLNSSSQTLMLVSTAR